MNPLLRWVILRRLAGEPFRTLLTLAGIALGVAVFVSIRLASHSALASFSDTVDAVTGRATLQVMSRSDGFDERWYPVIRGVPGIAAAAPVVEVEALAAPGRPPAPAALDMGSRGPYDESLLVLGVDPFAEPPFGRGGGGAGTGPGLLRLLGEPRTLAITRTLAARHGLAAGDTLTLLASGEPVPFTIVALITDEDLQQAYGGNVAIADLATVQESFHRLGRLDRVDLIVPDAARERVRSRLAARLPSDVAVERPGSRTRQVENMVSAFALNLTALSFIAVFVAMFLVFNAVATSVIRWRRELGILRAVGVTRGGLARLFLLEGLGLGAVGALLGLALGTWLAHGALGAVGGTLERLYLVEHTRTVRPDAFTYLAGLALGMGTALVAALAPALEAAGTPPAGTLREGAWLEARGLPAGRLALAGAVAAVVAALVALWTVRGGSPAGGFASAFLVLVAGTLTAPAVTLAAERLVRRPLAWLGRIDWILGARAVRETVTRASGVVAAVMVAVGMLVALQTMVGSFRRTVDTWITQTLRGDLYVEPAGHFQSRSATALPAEMVERTRRLPGVAAVDTYRAVPFRDGDRTAMAVGIDFDVQRRLGGLAFVNGEPRDDVLGRARARDEVIVTESFARRRGVTRGDAIVLPAPAGRTTVRIAGVFYDYSTDAGAVLMDRGLFARLWRDDRTESLALYLAPGASPDSVRRRFLALSGDRIFHVTPNQSLRARVLDVFDQTFRVTFALQGIAVLVAVLGVITTLTALVLQRGREIAMLRSSGARRGQIRTMVLVESGLLGAAGAVLGCLAGLALAVLLVFVINRQYFGWSIRFTPELRTFTDAIVLMTAVALLAGLVPARFAAARPPAEAMRVE